MKDTNVRLGYCCINLSLADQKITANRGMIRKTFQEKGVSYCAELAHQNIKDVLFATSCSSVVALTIVGRVHVHSSM